MVKDWKKLYNKKVFDISASKDALWVIDSDSSMPFKFDEKT